MQSVYSDGTTPENKQLAGRHLSGLDIESRPAVDTATAAHYLNRRPQTLRIWACREDGPIRPIRINGRLAWPVSELRRVLGVAQ